MPIVALDGQGLLERGIYGYDGASWRPVLIDATGHLLSSDLWTFGSLADGQLAAAEADLYLVPASTEAISITIYLHNVNAAARHVYLYIERSGGTSRKVLEVVLQTNESAVFEVAALSADDAVRGYASAVTSVNYEVVGATR